MKRMVWALLALLGMLIPTAAQAEPQYKLLILSIPNKYHYEYIPVARDSLERLAKLHAFSFTWANRTDVFDGDLSQYAAVMFLNTPGEELNAGQRAKFEAYMRAGGNAIVVHRAAITPPNDWIWYEKLVGRSFVNHPMLQTGVVTIADKGFPATFGLPDRWIWSDEYYVLADPFKVAISPVLNVDESSYDPTKIWPGQVAKPMGRDHPVAWYHPYEKGRVFVTTLGHDVEMYRDPVYLAHLMGGIYWTATGRGQVSR
ncbi:ThuA domain-containing protein [Sphingobium sp. AP49]|uniref:ThuA domain-containing protein n=1 Tax=Sphingobium sp. AP49 TaxID=1144307 RepID=UPI00026EE380|nr:ThuA domain-containing protein [Sphingobium sp. AP49]WHO41020.1 ThuA domain-containing protein [Sphingobium sp. AP49]